MLLGQSAFTSTLFHSIYWSPSDIALSKNAQQNISWKRQGNKSKHIYTRTRCFHVFSACCHLLIHTVTVMIISSYRPAYHVHTRPYFPLSIRVTIASLCNIFLQFRQLFKGLRVSNHKVRVSKYLVRVSNPFFVIPKNFPAARGKTVRGLAQLIKYAFAHYR